MNVCGHQIFIFLVVLNVNLAFLQVQMQVVTETFALLIVFHLQKPQIIIAIAMSLLGQ